MFLSGRSLCASVPGTEIPSSEMSHSDLKNISLSLQLTNPKRFVEPLLTAIQNTDAINHDRHFDLYLALSRVYLELLQIDEAKYYFALADALIAKRNDTINQLRITVARSAILEKVKDKAAARNLLKQSEMRLTRAGFQLTGYWQSRLAGLTADLGNMSEAKDRYQRLIKFYSLNDMKLEEAYIRIIFVNKLLYAGFYDVAGKELAAARVLANELNNPELTLETNRARARYFLRAGKYQDSASLYFNHLEWAEEVGSKLDIAFTSMALGVVFDELGETDQAESFYLRAKPLYDEMGHKEGSVVILYNLATLKMREELPDESERYFRDMLEFAEQQEMDYYIAFGNIGLGNIYVMREQPDIALEYLEKAKRYMKNDSRPDSHVNLYFSFGLAYTKARRFDEAENSLNKAYEMTVQHDMVNYRVMVVRYFIDLYKETKNWRLASKYQKEYSDLEKKIFDENKAQAIAEVAARYEEDKKVQEIEILSKDNALKAAELSRQESEKNLFLVMAIIAMIGILTLVARYFNLETKRKTRLYDKAFNTSAEAMWVATPELKIVVANPAYSEKTGKSPKSLVGTEVKLHSNDDTPDLLKKIVSVAQQDGHWQGEVFDKKADGTVYPIDFQLHPMYNEKNRITHYFGVFEDITDRHKARKELEHLATHDTLTQIPNRTLFIELLQRACERAEATQCYPAVLFIDLDNFKVINDSYGHEVGDNLLKIVAQKLKQLLKKDEVLARIGGDEFCVFLTSDVPAEKAVKLARIIINELTNNIEFQGRALSPTASIGIAIYPDDGKNSTALLRNADIAMYEVKDKTKNGFHFYEEGMNERIVAALEMEEKIKAGLQNREFELYFQPRVQVDGQHIVGGEALIRWPQKDGAMIYPDQFIPIAEKTQLIIEIDRYVIEHALQQISDWIKEGTEPGLISINLSAPHFSRPDALLSFLEEMLEKYQVPEKFLEIEITESMLLQEVEKAVATMQAIRALGVSLAVDDFGTGYSSLSYIQRFPLNVLKIDRTFIKNMHLSAKDQSVTKAVIKLAHSLQLRVVAEGVETEEHLKILTELECNEYQGYYFSRPIPAADFNIMVSKHKTVSIS